MKEILKVFVAMLILTSILFLRVSSAQAQGEPNIRDLWQEMTVARKTSYVLGYIDASLFMCENTFKGDEEKRMKCVYLFSPISAFEEGVNLDRLIAYYNTVYMKNKLNVDFGTATLMLNMHGESESINFMKK